jgi:CubicO group peptidase (beta-lactamase class C family)
MLTPPQPHSFSLQGPDRRCARGCANRTPGVRLSGLILALCALLPTTLLGQNPGDLKAISLTEDTSADQVRRIFSRWDSNQSPGCAVGVYKGGKIIYESGFGMADMDNDIPITPQSVFHVASMSKQFTAASIVLLAEDGKLALDDDVRKYVPELHDFGNPITLRNLLHHTSGLREEFDLLTLAGWRISQDLVTDDDELAFLERQKSLNFPPGQKFQYTNSNYTLLGQVVKRVSGESLRDFTTTRLFLPLAMGQTHFRDDHAEIVKHQALGYMRNDKTGSFELSIPNFDTVGATSLLTTIADLARWDENFYSPRIGGTGFIEQMLDQGKLNDGTTLSYALGLTIGTYRGLPIVEHGGADAGYRSDLIRFPKQHFSVACLCNLAGIQTAQLVREVADIYLKATLGEAETHPAEDNPNGSLPTKGELTAYTGFYWSPDEETAVKLSLGDGGILYILSFPNLENYQLRPLGGNQFWIAETSTKVTFERSDKDKPVSMIEESSIPGSSPTTDHFERAQEPTPSRSELEAYAGKYRSEELGSVFTIEVRNGELYVLRPKAAPLKLLPAHTDYFRGSRIGSFHFLRNKQDKQPTSFLLYSQRSRNLLFQKVSCDCKSGF